MSVPSAPSSGVADPVLSSRGAHQLQVLNKLFLTAEQTAKIEAIEAAIEASKADGGTP